MYVTICCDISHAPLNRIDIDLKTQVIWGGRWQDGSAWSTGEEVEQINAHLSRCGNTTKYMLPESKLIQPFPDIEYSLISLSIILFVCTFIADREELITEHVFAWNRRKILGLVTSLCKRYTRVSNSARRNGKWLIFPALIMTLEFGSKKLKSTKS